MRKAISMVHVPELNALTGRPPIVWDTCDSNSFTCGPEVSQPERKTSATPAIVASSIIGLVKGKNGLSALAAG
jgi:hypothetical protein